MDLKYNLSTCSLLVTSDERWVSRTSHTSGLPDLIVQRSPSLLLLIGTKIPPFFRERRSTRNARCMKHRAFYRIKSQHNVSPSPTTFDTQAPNPSAAAS